MPPSKEQQRTMQIGITRLSIYQLLNRNNIRPDTARWQDYECGKRMVTELDLTPEQHANALIWIADYVGV